MITSEDLLKIGFEKKNNYIYEYKKNGKTFHLQIIDSSLGLFKLNLEGELKFCIVASMDELLMKL